jgi:methionyl-tRNA formyltransferase
MLKVKDNCNNISSVLLFTDEFGLDLFLKYLPKDVICGVVSASIRPEQHQKMSTLCELHSLKFFIQPVSTAREYKIFERNIIECNPDIIWVNSYSMKLMNNILNVPRFGAINVHTSLLPKYRGCNPLQWAIINNERETGITLHKMNERFDAGDIIDQEKVAINFFSSWKDVKIIIEKKISHIIRRNVDQILSGKITSIPQSEHDASYYQRRTADDGCFLWSDPVIDIYNLTRALVSPLPGAYYIDNFGKKTRLTKFHKIEDLAVMKTKINEILFQHNAIEVRGLKSLAKNQLNISLDDNVSQSISVSILFTDNGKIKVELGRSKLKNVPELFLDTLEKCLKNEFRSECLITNKSPSA